MSTSTPITGVVLAAGLASRFHGKIKGLTPVGVHGETLLHVGLEQLKKCGVNDICMIVSPATEPQLRAVFGDLYLDLPIKYAVQTRPDWRQKPLGTVDALACLHGIVCNPFVVVNADTIYGYEALDLICRYLREHADANACCTAYMLRNCLPSNGSAVNRAVMTCDADGWMVTITEQYSISLPCVGTKFRGDEPTSLNVFGFRPEHIVAAQEKLAVWLAQLKQQPPLAPGAKEPEYILADFINTLHSEGALKLRVLGPTSATPLEITHPEDADLMRAQIAALPGSA